MSKPTFCAVIMGASFFVGVAHADEKSDLKKRMGGRDNLASLDAHELDGMLGVAPPSSPEPDSPPPKPSKIDATEKPGIAVGYQLESGLASTYVNRGVPQYTTMVDPSSQSMAALTLKSLGPGDLTLSAVNAVALNHFNAQPGTAVEVDLGAAYGASLGGIFNMQTGYSVALYPKGAERVDGAHEVFASLALSQGFITPSIAVFGEFVRMKGAYADVGLSKAFSISTFTFTPSVTAGVAGYEGVPAHLNDVTTSLTALWSFSDPMYITLRGSYSYLGGSDDVAPDLNGDGTPDRHAPAAYLAFGAQH